MSETAAAAWTRCRPYVEAALERAGGTHGIDDVARLVGEGRAHFWPGRRCAVVTEFYDYPRLRACNLWLLGGELKELMALRPAIEAWARAQGCTRILGGGTAARMGAPAATAGLSARVDHLLQGSESMSFSSSQKNTSGTSTSSLDPQFADTVYGNYDRASDLANTPFQPYAGQQVASFTPTQIAAQNAYTAIGQNGVGNAPLQTGIDLATTAGSYQPQSVTSTPLTSVDLSGYMNPYTQQVVDSTLSDLDRQNQIADQNDASTATKAGAFGGSRSAVLQSLDDDNYARDEAATAANLNQANYSQAQSTAESDLGREQAASQANQSAGLQGAGLNLNAASALAGMGSDQLNQALAQAGALSTAGNAQQQNQQAQLNAAYQQWQLAQQYPIQMQQLLDSAIGLIPKTGTTDTTGSETDNSVGMNSDIGDLEGFLGIGG